MECFKENNCFIVMQEVSDALSNLQTGQCFDLSGFFSAVGDRQEARGF